MSKRIWILALLSHLLLIVLVAWREASALGWVISALLLLPLPGLIRQNTRTAAWASMLVMFYVAGYLGAGYADASARWSAFAMAALAGVEYLSLLMFVRWRAVETRRLAAASSEQKTG